MAHTRPSQCNTEHADNKAHAILHERFIARLPQGVREAYLLALQGVLSVSGGRLQPATMVKVSAALSDLRGDQGVQQQEALLSSLRVQALHAAAWMARPSLAALHVGLVDLAPAPASGCLHRCRGLRVSV